MGALSLNKTTFTMFLTVMLLCGILAVSQILRVKAAELLTNGDFEEGGEEITNGGFEDGLNDWENDTGAWLYGSGHSGLEACELHHTDGWIEQTLYHEVAVASVDTFECYVDPAGNEAYPNNLTLIVTYTDDSNSTDYFELIYSGSWQFLNLKPYLTDGKTIKKIKFVEFIGNAWIAIDDVSCLTDDLTGWTKSGNPVVHGSYNRSGSYGCQITMIAGQYHEYVEQTGFNTMGTAIAYMNFQNGIGGYYADVFSVGSAPFRGFEIHSDSLYVGHGAGTINITKITFDQWYKLEIVVNGTHIRWYLDDGLEHTDASSLNMTRFRIGCSLGNPYAGHESWIDDCSLDSSPPPPNSSYECRVVSDPEITAQWKLDTIFYYTPWNDNITQGSRTLEAKEITATRDSGVNIYGFSHWMATNSSGSFNFTTASITLDIQTEHNFTIFYENSYTVNVSSTPYTSATFTATGYAYTAPQTLTRNNATHTFVCTLFEVSVNASYKYTFDHWTINGSGYYGSLNIDVLIEGDTNLTMYYIGSWISSPYIPSFAANALNATWYMRSDAHTTHDQLGYKLLTVNTATETYDHRDSVLSLPIGYGIRVWAIDIFGNLYELSSGVPTAIVNRTNDGAGILSAYFDCPAHNLLIDAIQVNVYQRFSVGMAWNLRRIFITNTNLYIRLPESSWQIHYYVNRTTSSTHSYFFFGSSSYNSRIDLQYYRANPWEIAMARLNSQNYFGFLFTPWTYWLGDVFWSLMLLFAVVTMYMRFGSLKPILALLWIFGGVGSVLSSMIPALVLNIAWLMLAVAMGITLFKLIYR